MSRSDVLAMEWLEEALDKESRIGYSAARKQSLGRTGSWWSAGPNQVIHVFCTPIWLCLCQALWNWYAKAPKPLVFSHMVSDTRTDTCDIWNAFPNIWVCPPQRFQIKTWMMISCARDSSKDDVSFSWGEEVGSAVSLAVLSATRKTNIICNTSICDERFLWDAALVRC